MNTGEMIERLRECGLLQPRPEYPPNPQAEEIAQLKKEWKEQGESEWLKAQRAKRCHAWRNLVKAVESGEIPPAIRYDESLVPTLPDGLTPVIPAEGAIMDRDDELDEFDEMQRYLRERVRFREGNLYFKLETANPQSFEDYERGYRMATRSFAVAEVLDKGLAGKALEDLEDWKVFLVNILKPTFYGRTWAEIEADPPDCVDSIKLAGTLVFVTRSDAKHVQQCAFEVYVGDPRSLDSWLV